MGSLRFAKRHTPLSMQMGSLFHRYPHTEKAGAKENGRRHYDSARFFLKLGYVG